MLELIFRETGTAKLASRGVGYLLAVLVLAGSLEVVHAAEQASRQCLPHSLDSIRQSDYRDRDPSAARRMDIVTRVHFSPGLIQRALAGEPKRAVYEGLSYTLRRIPNNHEALWVMSIWQYKIAKFQRDFFTRLKGNLLRLKRGEQFRDVSCWFELARQMAPNDVGVYNTHGRVLHLMGQRKGAVEAFKKVLKLAPDSPEGHYNLGLAYYSVGAYAKSAESARRAQELGHTRRELQNRLKRKGHWSN